MVIQNILMPGGSVYMRVYFRRGYIFMPKHFLHGKKVCPVLYQMGGERMTEGVG